MQSQATELPPLELQAVDAAVEVDQQDLGVHGAPRALRGPGTVQVVDLATGITDSNPRSLTVYKNALYFFANSGVGRELVKTTGTPGNASTVRDIATGGASGITEDYEAIAIMGAGTPPRMPTSRNTPSSASTCDDWLTNM